ncbi:MAG: Asp/Glu/hydantoin racemase [Acidobacteria bacterium]|nr:Asp/Glu/hydantoin racemase [Acidobacteriota bacterium]
MKILIINPNSDPAMTAAIQKTAETFAAGDFEVITEATPGAPPFIETYEDAARAAPGMADLVRLHECDCDAIVVACHCDPNLDLMKEITSKPVVGIGEASMKLATMLGHRFSVISVADRSIPNKEALVRAYHLEGSLASVRATNAGSGAWGAEAPYLEAARKALQEDMAEVIVLGCAGATGLDRALQAALHVPVLDGVICALIIASGLARYGVATSKARRYCPK